LASHAEFCVTFVSYPKSYPSTHPHFGLAFWPLMLSFG